MRNSNGQFARQYTLNPHVFDKIDNEHAAYWLGFLYADGSVYRNTLKLDIKISDKAHVEKFGKFLETDRPVFERTGISHHNANMEANHFHLASRLRELGMLPQRPNYRLAIDNVPNELLHHWVRGYFDGDGSARKAPSLVFCGQEDLLIWMRSYFAKHAATNPNLAVSKHRTANIYYLHFGGRLVALRAAKVMYQDATIWLERKLNVINSWPHHTQKGEGNAASILTERDVLKIRKQYATQEISYGELGRQYKVTKATIHRVIKRKSWKHI